nr:glucosamine-6-phosphate deaminase [Thermogutta sp.]
MEVVIKETYEEMCRAAAEAVASVLNAKPNAVLGLAVGNTHIGLYRELVRMFKEGLLDFSQVTTFNLDEYVGLGKDHPQSQYYFMHENFFKYVNLSPQNIYMPSGTAKNYRAFCAWYEQRIKECGGIDLQILGIGTDGHIAFNEPGSSLGSRTRIKTLSERRLAEIKDLFDAHQSTVNHHRQMTNPVVGHELHGLLDSVVGMGHDQIAGHGLFHPHGAKRVLGKSAAAKDITFRDDAQNFLAALTGITSANHQGANVVLDEFFHHVLESGVGVNGVNVATFGRKNFLQSHGHSLRSLKLVVDDFLVPSASVSLPF